MHEDSLLYFNRYRLSFIYLFVSSTNLGCACACAKHTGVIQECFPSSRSCQGTGGHKAGGNSRDLDEHFFPGMEGWGAAAMGSCQRRRTMKPPFYHEWLNLFFLFGVFDCWLSQSLASNLTRLMIERTFHRLASVSEYFRPCFFSTTHMFPVLLHRGIGYILVVTGLLATALCASNAFPPGVSLGAILTLGRPEEPVTYGNITQ